MKPIIKEMIKNSVILIIPAALIYIFLYFGGKMI